jgi:hypothetical protein
MVLDSNLWYVKWFMWSCHVLDYFCSTSEGRDWWRRSWEYNDGTNLCHFFRTLMWGTLITSATAALYLYAVYVLIYLPFHLFTFHDISFVAMLVTFMLAGVAVLILGVIFGLEYLGRFFRFLQKETVRPSFVRVTMTYLAAVKKKYCPTITFKGR